VLSDLKKENIYLTKSTLLKASHNSPVSLARR
jgi:hypothetical protein